MINVLLIKIPYLKDIISPFIRYFSVEVLLLFAIIIVGLCCELKICICRMEKV